MRHRRGVLWVVVGLLGMWGFGNLYEEVVTMAGVIARPLPGALPGSFDAGSPVFYYLPWVPVSFVLMVVLVVKFGGGVPTRVRRMWTVALGLVALGVSGKMLLITLVNPTFRDPTISAETVRATAIGWEFGNGVVILLVAGAIAALARSRRET